MIRSYREMKSRYNGIRIAENYVRTHYETPSEECVKYIADTWTDFRKECREFYKYVNKYHADRLSVPVLNNKNVWRTVSDDNGETGTDFIIIPDNGETEEDIKEIVYDSVFCGYGDLLIDCTGKRCTRSWGYRRTPCGIAIIHRWCFDW